jgi:hypothetical protein
MGHDGAPGSHRQLNKIDRKETPACSPVRLVLPVFSLKIGRGTEEGLGGFSGPPLYLLALEEQR